MSKDNKFASRRKILSNGGLAYVKRKIDSNVVNIFWFRFQNSRSSLTSWIGVESLEPKNEWWVRLKDGKKFESGLNGWQECSNQKFWSGSVIQMTIDGEALSLKVDEKELGLIFTSKMFVSNNIFASIFIVDSEE